MGRCRVNFKFNFTLQYFNDIYKIARSGDHTDNNIPPSLIKKLMGILCLNLNLLTYSKVPTRIHLLRVQVRSQINTSKSTDWHKSWAHSVRFLCCKSFLEGCIIGLSTTMVYVFFFVRKSIAQKSVIILSLNITKDEKLYTVLFWSLSIIHNSPVKL